MRASHPRTLALRGAAVVTATLVLAALVGTWGAATAEATSYRFWSYWVGSDEGWSFSNQGASRRPADGTVDGWRFAVSEASSSTTPPRHTASFSRICGSTAPHDGKKRVGLVVDFGTSADAPDGETPPALLTACVVVPQDANGYAVLATAVQLRTDAGLICGMNGYPATECGVAVADPTTSPSPTPTKNGGGGAGPGSGGGGSPGSGTSSTPSKQADATTSGGGADASDQKKSSQKKNKSKEAAVEPDTDAPAASGVVDVSPAAAVSPSSSASGSPLGLMVGGAVVAILVATAFVVRRRRT